MTAARSSLLLRVVQEYANCNANAAVVAVNEAVINMRLGKFTGSVQRVLRTIIG